MKLVLLFLPRFPLNFAFSCPERRTRALPLYSHPSDTVCWKQVVCKQSRGLRHAANDLLSACVSFTSEVGVLIKFGGLLPGAEEEDLLVSG